MKIKPIRKFFITPHAAFEMRRRGLLEDLIRKVLEAPEQRLDLRPGRVVLQSQMTFGSPGETYLVRVFVDVERRPTAVVTAYRTSKVAKYWKESP